jgi:hypothetical protein
MGEAVTVDVRIGIAVHAQIGTSMLLFAGRRDCELFVRFLLSDEYRLDGIYSNASVHRGPFRSSDRAARIAVSVQILRMSGWTSNEACIFVAEIVGKELGQSRRGRRPVHSQTRDLASKVQTVRSLWKSYQKRQFKSIAPLALWRNQFFWWKQWIFWSDDGNFDFLTEMFRKKRNDGAAERFRNAIEACKATLPAKPEPGDWSWPLYQSMMARGWGYLNGSSDRN